MTDETTENVPEKGGRYWAHFRRLLVFQIKLYVDAFRDLIMSPIAIVAYLLDLVQGKSGSDSHFEGALRVGRKSEEVINLFNQYDAGSRETYDVDAAIEQIEESISRHYKEGDLSKKAREALERTLTMLRRDPSK